MSELVTEAHSCIQRRIKNFTRGRCKKPNTLQAGVKLKAIPPAIWVLFPLTVNNRITVDIEFFSYPFFIYMTVSLDWFRSKMEELLVRLQALKNSKGRETIIELTRRKYASIQKSKSG